MVVRGDVDSWEAMLVADTWLASLLESSLFSVPGKGGAKGLKLLGFPNQDGVGVETLPVLGFPKVDEAGLDGAKGLGAPNAKEANVGGAGGVSCCDFPKGDWDEAFDTTCCELPKGDWDEVFDTTCCAVPKALGGLKSFVLGGVIFPCVLPFGFIGEGLKASTGVAISSSESPEMKRESR